MSNYEEKLDSLIEMHKVQGTDGNWDYDDYMRGLFNGLEMALAIFQDRDPKYRLFNKEGK